MNLYEFLYLPICDNRSGIRLHLYDVPGAIPDVPTEQDLYLILNTFWLTNFYFKRNFIVNLTSQCEAGNYNHNKVSHNSSF